MNRVGIASIAMGLLIAVTIISLMMGATRGYTISGTIVITEDGVPRIFLNGTLERDIEEIQLPSDPTPASVVVYVEGELRTPVVINNSVIISGQPGQSFTIEYIPEVDTSGEGVAFRYYSGYDSILRVSSRVVLLSLPETILESFYDDDGTFTVKFRGLYEIRYVVSEVATPPEPPPTASEPLPWNLVLVAVLASIVAVGFLAWRYRSAKTGEVDLEEAGFLDETDHLILEALEEAGGEMYQSELMRRLGIPKTTLWRHIRRLEVLGYVEVIKEYRRNRIRLLRKP